MPLERVGQKGALARGTGNRLGATGTGTSSRRPRSIRKHSEEGCSNLRMRPQCSRECSHNYAKVEATMQTCNSDVALLIMRTFTTTLWSHAPVAAAFLRMLRNASRTFRAGTGTSGPQSVTCPSGPLNQAADGRRHFYWYLPDIAPFVFWRPRGMFSITSCLPIACHRLWA